MKLPTTRRHWVLTLLLSTGISIQGCDRDECGCGRIEGNYFDIKGISADNFKKRGTCCSDRVSSGQEVKLEDYSLIVRYSVSYFSRQTHQNHQAPFSLISQAYACTCRTNGGLGSKEKLKSFTVVTLNNFDAQHQANDTINDLLTISTASGAFDLSTGIKTDTTSIKQTDYSLLLKKKPVADFAARISVELQNGEVYTSTTESVRIR
ncbi:hypothetical protein [Hymenobacter lapidiphilus]|uniref:hypothetical protein n=1 Tax=Hymenobacter sp. CCM 8763 TaxID=2303334 RepID=UPI0011C109C4|nr:hypothetical protein [Hymenobacter sp. CCM 8763]